MNFCLFFKNICYQLRPTSAHGIFSYYQNFVKPYQTSKALSSCRGVGQISIKTVRLYNWQPLNVNQVNLILLLEFIHSVSHDYQLQNLVETKFVDIFGRAKQILST